MTRLAEHSRASLYDSHSSRKLREEARRPPTTNPISAAKIRHRDELADLATHHRAAQQTADLAIQKWRIEKNPLVRSGHDGGAQLAAEEQIKRRKLTQKHSDERGVMKRRHAKELGLLAERHGER